MKRSSTAAFSTLLLLVLALASPAQIIAVNTTADTPDANPGDGICADANGACSLRAAIQEVNASAPTMSPARIRLQNNATYALTLAGADEDAAATGDLDILNDIEIIGRNATIDAGGLDRAFDVPVGTLLILGRLTIVNGAVTDASGGGVRSAGDLVVFGVTITGCSATGTGASGGAIFNAGGHLRVNRSTLSNNSASRAGGAIEANAGFTEILLSDFDGNDTGPLPGNGGGLHLTGNGIVNVESGDFTNNTAAREGGGLWNSATGIMNLGLCNIAGNRADGVAADDGGGGLFNDGGLMQVILCEIRDNDATMGSGSGGGIFNNNGQFVIVASEISGNQSNRAGGGIEAAAGTTAVVSCLLTNNSTGAAPGNGGALHLTGAGLVGVSSCLVTNNTAAAEGGGLWNSAVGTMTVAGGTISGNVASGAAADQGGGGLFNDGGTMNVFSTTIRDNLADGAAGSGGGILNNDGILNVLDTIFTENASNRAGGAIEARLGATAVSASAFFSNSTGASPGNGGAFHTTGAGIATIAGCLVLLNDASNEGGGLWNSSTGTMTVTTTPILGNSAPVGADVFNQGGTFTIDGVPVP